jgi:site-specific DNA-methyltransferase (adenine-specific)
MEIGNGTFLHGDCLELMRSLSDGSVDMVLCDLPYGTTQNKWDSVIPFAGLWEQYWRVCKPNAAIVLTAAQPFTSALVMSQVQYFKYDWTWKKPKGTGHLNAKKMPMRDKEDILVFCRGTTPYNPQFGHGDPYKNKAGKNPETGLTDNYGSFGNHRDGSDGKRYPKQVLEMGVVERGTVHPTQKPVALFEYLIRTYTNPGDLVLDNTAGSGTTAIAAENAGRKWICMERDPTYYESAVGRVYDHLTR